MNSTNHLPTSLDLKSATAVGFGLGKNGYTVKSEVGILYADFHFSEVGIWLADFTRASQGSSTLDPPAKDKSLDSGNPKNLLTGH